MTHDEYSCLIIISFCIYHGSSVTSPSVGSHMYSISICTNILGNKYIHIDNRPLRRHFCTDEHNRALCPNTVFDIQGNRIYIYLYIHTDVCHLLPLKNLLWAKIRDYTISRVNPNPRKVFLIRILKMWWRNLGQSACSDYIYILSQIGPHRTVGHIENL